MTDHESHLPSRKTLPNGEPCPCTNPALCGHCTGDSAAIKAKLQQSHFGARTQEQRYRQLQGERLLVKAARDLFIGGLTLAEAQNHLRAHWSVNDKPPKGQCGTTADHPQRDGCGHCGDCREYSIWKGAHDARTV